MATLSLWPVICVAVTNPTTGSPGPTGWSTTAQHAINAVIAAIQMAVLLLSRFFQLFGLLYQGGFFLNVI